MPNLPKFRVIQYIEDFARTSAVKFHWYHDDVFQQSILLAVVTIKIKYAANPSYLTLFDKLVSANSNIFKALMLRLLLASREDDLIIKIASGFPNRGDHTLSYLFDEVYMQFENDLSKNFTQVQVNKLSEIVNSLHDALIQLGYHFIKTAYTKNLVDVLSEELYLLREIDAFRNRQD